MHIHLRYTSVFVGTATDDTSYLHFTKAWNNVNLTRLAEKTKSPLVL